MISKKSMDAMILYHRLGSWMKVVDWSWDPHKECIVLLSNHNEAITTTPKINWLRVGLLAQIVLRVIFVLFIILQVVYRQSVEPAEFIFAMFMICVVVMPIVVHVQYYLSGPDFVRHMNSLLHIKRISGMGIIRLLL